MANKLTLYRNCKITEEKNFQVDNITDYLTSIGSTKLTFDNFQYIKQDLDVEVKIPLSQDYLEANITNNYNYCTIQNDGGAIYYYFIRSKSWAAKETVKLNLHLDVLNTYKGKYNLTDKTTILRQHKDRFIKQSRKSTAFQSWLDGAEWTWGDTAAGYEGAADFDLPTLIGYPNITVDFQDTFGYSFTYEWDSSIGALTLYCLPGMEQPPQEQISVEVVAPEQAVLIDNKLVKNIDFNTEGLNTISFKKSDSGKLLQNFKYIKDGTEITVVDDNRYYLIYQTNNNYDADDPDSFVYNNPINCYLAADEPMNMASDFYTKVDLTTISDHNHHLYISLPSGASGKHLKNSFSENWPETVISNNNLPSIKFICYKADNSIIGEGFLNMELVGIHNRKRSRGLEIYYDLNQWKVAWKQLKRDNVVESTKHIFTEVAYISFFKVSKVQVYPTTLEGTGPNWYNRINNHPGQPLTFESVGPEEQLYVAKPLKDWDLTDEKIIKIVELPYLPDGSLKVYTARIEGELKYITLFYGDDWTYENGSQSIKLNLKNNSYFDSLLYFNTGNFNPGKKLLTNKPASFSLTANRNDAFESKLSHSDFYNLKLVYDNFNYNFNLEYFKAVDLATAAYNTEYNQDTLFARFVKGTVPSGSFALDIRAATYFNTALQDYANIFTVSRNLDYPIFNNYYYNYLKNGYNYDVKNKQASKIASGVGIGLSAASLAAGIALSATGYGAALGAGAIIGGITGLAGSITGAISSSSQADRNLQQKIDAAKEQGASVQGADDLGLLDYYTGGNKFKLVEYDLAENTKEKVADLFYYCGYRVDKQALPDTTSRCWFNFLQAEPVYDETAFTAKISKAEKDELTEKYKAGITVLHKQVISGSNTWNFSQDKENWETWLVN